LIFGETYGWHRRTELWNSLVARQQVVMAAAFNASRDMVNVFSHLKST
jgi:hypothetical protein